MDREEQQKLLLDQMHRNIAAAKKSREDACPHMQGSGGPQPWGSGTSIVWHLFDSGIVRGFCTTCLKHFNPVPEDAIIDKDFIAWYRKPSGNVMSGGGQPNSLVELETLILQYQDRYDKLKQEIHPIRTAILKFLKGLFKW